MRIWIMSGCLGVALAAATASGPAVAYDGRWNGAALDRSPLLRLVDDAPVSGCLGFQRKDGRWDHDCGFGPENPDHSGEVTSGDIARKVREAGYSAIYDIDRDGNRFEAIAGNEGGDLVVLYFDAESGAFIKKRHY